MFNNFIICLKLKWCDFNDIKSRPEITFSLLKCVDALKQRPKTLFVCCSSSFFVLINPPVPFSNLHQPAWFPNWEVAAVDLFCRDRFNSNWFEQVDLLYFFPIVDLAKNK